MALNADMFTDMFQALMKDPHLWAAVLSIVLIIGFVAMVFLWAKHSDPIQRDDVL